MRTLLLMMTLAFQLCALTGLLGTRPSRRQRRIDRRIREIKADLARQFCGGCPDHEACSQGACHLVGGPVRPSEVPEPVSAPVLPPDALTVRRSAPQARCGSCPLWGCGACTERSRLRDLLDRRASRQEIIDGVGVDVGWANRPAECLRCRLPVMWECRCPRPLVKPLSADDLAARDAGVNRWAYGGVMSGPAGHRHEDDNPGTRASGLWHDGWRAFCSGCGRTDGSHAPRCVRPRGDTSFIRYEAR